MSAKQAANRVQFESSLDRELTNAAGTDSLEPVQPSRDVDAESSKPRLVQVRAPPAFKEPEAEQPAAEVNKTHSAGEAEASSMLETVMRVYMIRPPRPQVSTFTPSSLRMFYIIHQMNTIIVNNFYARRAMPALHPYPVRIYFGILFIVQTMRCMLFTNSIDQDQADFITRFLKLYPPEDLHIPGPLLALFKALSTSQPEDAAFGKVCPRITDALGPSNKSDLLRNSVITALLPQIPILLALNAKLTSLESTVASVPQWSPIKPGTANLPAQVAFMDYTFSMDRTQWGNTQSWALAAPGVEYHNEANAALMDAYRQNAFILEIPDAPADIEFTANFLGLQDLEWFGRLNVMMANYAKFWHGSGTLSDCSVSGVSSNQVYGRYLDQATAPTKPTGFGDPASRVKLVCTHKTTTKEMTQLHEQMAFNAHLNMELPSNHPRYPSTGRLGTAAKAGPFWDIRPESSPSSVDDTYISISAKVSSMHIQKGLL